MGVAGCSSQAVKARYIGAMLGRHALRCWLVLGLLGCGTDDTTTDAGVSCEALTDLLAQPGDPIDGDTFSTMARPFFDDYCVSCHDSARTTRSDRGGAPIGFDWDQEDSVRAHLPEIRHAVGVTNFMPFRAPFPTCDERARLVRWIDADAP